MKIFYKKTTVLDKLYEANKKAKAKGYEISRVLLNDSEWAEFINEVPRFCRLEDRVYDQINFFGIIVQKRETTHE